MLNHIITFSELVKNANIYYKKALDQEKREIALQVFSELIYKDGIAQYKPKEGFAALFMRHNVMFGSRGRIRTDDQLVTLVLMFP